jgi:FdhD protein
MASRAPSRRGTDAGPPRSRRVMVYEPRDHGLGRRPDQLAIEEPLEIRIESPAGGQTLGVTMRTPGNDAELVTGWLLAEGIIDGIDDVAGVNHCVEAANGGDQRFNVVTASLRVPPRQSDRSRTAITSSACGVCGTASIEALRAVGLPALGAGPRFDLATIGTLPDQLRTAQRTFEVTGAVHGVALFDRAAEMLVVREDVGRHNAVDKVVGWAVLDHRMPLANIALVVSGRISFEIVQKAARAGIAMVVAVSGATSLAVALGEELGITVIGFARGGRCTVYCGPERVATA